MPHAEALQSLVEEFPEESQIEVVMELLGRFLVLSPTDIYDSFRSLAEQVVNIWKLSQETTQICAVSWDDNADSGQAVIHALKTPLASFDASYPLINTVPKGAKKLPTHPNIVLVDEFAGTGLTIVNRIEWLRKNAEQRNIACNISVALIACMESAKTVIEETGVPVFASNILKKGISAHHTGHELNNRLAVMETMESVLTESWKEKPMPNLGYGRAEALYAADGWNLPNSVFPIFWWPKKKPDILRKVLFRRMEP